MTASIYDYSCRLNNDKMLPLSDLRGQVLLIVNTASYCRFTPQYSGLETLYKSYNQHGFTALGFPSNDSMQEPHNDEQVHNFCLSNYGVSFPLIAKTHVNGNKEEPLLTYLERQAPGRFSWRAIKWNLSKLLIDRSGYVTTRLGPQTLPSRLRGPIEKLLNQPVHQSSADVS